MKEARIYAIDGRSSEKAAFACAARLNEKFGDARVAHVREVREIVHDSLRNASEKITSPRKTRGIPRKFSIAFTSSCIAEREGGERGR